MTDSEYQEADFDGDGSSDALVADTDSDGQIDSAIVVDSDGNVETYTDTDGNSVLDRVEIDVNGDGLADMTSADLDEDGTLDVTQFDLNRDGITDAVQIAGHTLIVDASGRIVDDQPTDSGDVTPADESAVSDTGAAGVDTTSDDDTVNDPSANDTAGDDTPTTTDDPEQVERTSDAQNWFEESENGFCAPSSVAMIVAEYSHQSIPNEDAFVQRAEDLGYLTYDQSTQEWSGLTVEQTKDLLESFGVQATVQHGDVDTLDSYLDRGYNAIVAIDSSEIWYGSGTGNADHAVVVSSIENGMVYLDDPGSPDGQLEPVPVDVFEKAWAASDDSMIVTDQPDLPVATPGVGVDTDDNVETEGTPDQSDPSSSAGTVLLPITIAGADVTAWHADND